MERTIETWQDGELVGTETVTVPPDQADRERRDLDLASALTTLRQWADDAEATAVTQGNAVQVLNVVVDRLGVFFDRFADLLENRS